MSKRTKDAMDIVNTSVTVDCCIVKLGVFWTITEKDMGDDYDPWSMLPPVNCIQYHSDYIDDSEGPWGIQGFGENTFKYPRAAHTKLGEMLIIGTRGAVWYHGLGENKRFEDPIPTDLVRGVYAIKNIHGIIYVVGTHRAVVRRDGINKWTLISEDIKNLSQKTFEMAQKKGGSFDPGFECIDGFEAHKELYAAGGKGDVWYFNGKEWAGVDIPLAQMHISGICCAADGYVYIAGRFGALLRGRGDSWEIINHQQTEADFRDIVDYNGTVYICTEGELYTVEKNTNEKENKQADKQHTLNTVDFGAMGKPFSFSALYANHGLLMASGSFSTCIFNGKDWKLLYGSAKMEEMVELNVLSHATDQLEEAIIGIMGSE